MFIDIYLKKDMKPNKKLLDTELNKTRKLMEDIGIVNSGDLANNNWSANYHLYKKQGLSSFKKNGYVLTALNKPIEHKLGGVTGPGDIRVSATMSGKLKDSVYMTQEQADELNAMGEEIIELIHQYNEKYQQYAKE